MIIFFDFGENLTGITNNYYGGEVVSEHNNYILWENIFFTAIPINYIRYSNKIIRIRGSTFTVIRDRFSSDVLRDLQEHQKHDTIIKMLSTTIK